MEWASTLEFRHRLAGPVIALGERVRALATPVMGLRWPRSRRNATVHVILFGIFGWITAATVYFAGAGDRTIVGPLKGADFVHFYTLGHLAASGRIAPIYDMKALHEAQVDLVPASESTLYPTVYPPQAAMIFAPFSGWSYRSALLLWSMVTLALYAVIVWSTWRRVAVHRADSTLVLAAAAAFPPFFSLILYGQISIVILAAFWLGWLALERGRPYLAGAAFGIVAIKPQFGLPLAVIVLACGEWRMLVGAVGSVTAQAAAVWLMLGSAVFTSFAASVPFTLRHADWLQSKPYMSHSIRTVTRLLPNWAGLPLWAALVAVVLWYTVKIWKGPAPLRLRLGVLILASVLVNPHLIVYDLVLLVLQLIWFAGYLLERGREAQAAAFGRTVYWLFPALIVPTAPIIGIQVSVLLMTGLLVFMVRVASDSPVLAR